MNYEQYSTPELEVIKLDFETERMNLPENDFISIGYYKTRLEEVNRIIGERNERLESTR